ncbi:(Fe-S)-binding protein [Gorillibacterium sp. sgz5001074]|uniref:(Fe-S)-binding protein n=1 Tax=Gorillibacterium sp. sgz5001074 TaxID=3446695 RepID=UPI003F6673FF
MSGALKIMPELKRNPAAERMKELMNYDELQNCIRCGFCLPACPTYRETGLEAFSPRGRIALMKAAVDGHMHAGDELRKQLDLCLGCRACEPACPSGVQYGGLLESAKEAIEENTRHPAWIEWIRTAAFKHLFVNQKRMRLLGGLIRFYQKSGLQRLTRKLGLLRILPDHMRSMEAILPEASSSGVALELGTFIPAKGPKRGTAGMFSGCIMDILFLETNKNTVMLLSEAGYDVVIPPGQNCCGALHAHSGENEGARKLAVNNIRAFKEAQVDVIVSNAGGCGAMLKEYDHLLHHGKDGVTAEDAKWFSARVKDVSEVFLELAPLDDFGELDGSRVTYQGSCHLQNVMKVKNPPRQIIRGIRGVRYVELHESDRCCGSAGIYNVVQPEMAGGIIDEKMVHVKRTQADILVTSNPGCLLQMKHGIHKAGISGEMRAVHLVDLLAEARKGRGTADRNAMK